MGVEVSTSGVIVSTDEIVREAVEGRVFILLDDEDRENEGDLVVLADAVSADAINFMIRYGSGIVCLALAEHYLDRLGLSLVPRSNAGDNCAAFATSIDARHGITTGVSSQDRAVTISTAVREGSSGDDLVTPGHVFPIIADSGGVLKRAGHTEAGVEIAKLAGASHAAVVCELMNPDGTMSRLPEIVGFAREHGLKITTINRLAESLRS